MKAHRFLLIPLLGCSILASGLSLHAQERTYSPDQVTQMVAPIALYPDALLGQVLMAATYPAQVTEADRWVQANPDLTGSALDNALATATWDPSVIALSKFPTVLDRMAQNMTWTTDLGIAFLNQRTDVMDAVQDLRDAAYENGTLRTNEQEQVLVEGQGIVIQPSTPEVIYVPVYQPSVVYGSYWRYPSSYYPGVWDPWPGYSFVNGFAWGFGYHLGNILFGGCDWGHHDVWMDFGVLHRHSMYRNASHHHHGCGGGDCGRQRWNHHSGGVDYHNGGTGAPYGGRSNERVNGIQHATLRANRGDMGSVNTRTVHRGQTGSTTRDLSRTTQRDMAPNTTRNTGRPTVDRSTGNSARGAGRMTLNSSTIYTTRGANRQTAGRSTDYSARSASRPSVGDPRNATARGGNRSAALGPTGYAGNRSVQRGQTGAAARDHNRPTAKGSSSYSARGANRPSVNGSSNYSGRSYSRPSASGPSGYGRSGSSHSSARPSAPSGRASAPSGHGGGGRGASAPRGGGGGRGNR